MALIVAEREAIAEQLWLRDEHGLAVSMLDVDDATYRKVMEFASKPFIAGPLTMRLSIDDLLVAGAIRVLTGKSSKPRRRQPLPEQHAEGLWAQVGRERDGRDPDNPVSGLKPLLP